MRRWPSAGISPPVVVALVAALFLGCADKNARISALADRIQGAERTSRDQRRFKESLALLEDSDFAPRRLRRYSDDALQRLYGGLRRATFQLPEDSRLVDWQARVLREKARRGRVDHDDAAAMLKAYLGSRQFDRARALRADFGAFEFPLVPEVTDSTTAHRPSPWAVYDVEDDGKKVHLTSLPLGSGPKIVVAMFTGCGVTEQAMTDILAQPEFAERFRANAILLTERFDSAGVAMWRKHFA